MLETSDLLPALTTTRVAQLQGRLAASGSGLFVLIDPLLGDPVLPQALPAELPAPALDQVRSAAWQRPTYGLYLPAALKMDGAFAPYLVELQGEADPRLADTVAWALQETQLTWSVEPDELAVSPHRVGGWLQSSTSGDTLAKQLSGWLQLSTRTSTRAHYLRLADRRVWSLCVHVLGEGAVTRQFALLQAWHWLDAHAAWRCLQRGADSGTHPSPSAPMLATPLATFSTEQWSFMTQGETVHRQLAQAAGQRMRRTPLVPPISHYPPVEPSDWCRWLQPGGPQSQTNPRGHTTP